MTIPRRLDNDYAAGRAHGYGIGCMDGANRQSQRDRIKAFAAIRRAAEVARIYEAFAASGVYTASEERALRIRAEAIRQAIRAAIESEKS